MAGEAELESILLITVGWEKRQWNSLQPKIL